MRRSQLYHSLMGGGERGECGCNWFTASCHPPCRVVRENRLDDPILPHHFLSFISSAILPSPYNPTEVVEGRTNQPGPCHCPRCPPPPYPSTWLNSCSPTSSGLSCPHAAATAQLPSSEEAALFAALTGHRSKRFPFHRRVWRPCAITAIAGCPSSRGQPRCTLATLVTTGQSTPTPAARRPHALFSGLGLSTGARSESGTHQACCGGRLAGAHLQTCSVAAVGLPHVFVSIASLKRQKRQKRFETRLRIGIAPPAWTFRR